MATVNCLLTNIVLFCAQCKKEAQLEDELIMTQFKFLGELSL